MDVSRPLVWPLLGPLLAQLSSVLLKTQNGCSAVCKTGCATGRIPWLIRHSSYAEWYWDGYFERHHPSLGNRDGRAYLKGPIRVY